MGDEILSGKRQDKHLAKVIELLSARGLALATAEYVGDDRPRIEAALRARLRVHADWRDCVLDRRYRRDARRSHPAVRLRLGVPLALHPQAEALIRERMRDVAREQGAYEPDRADNVHRLNMGVFPDGAEIIPNPYNKIPGFGGRRALRTRLPGDGVADD